jgi:N-acetylglucosaminyl-diphospho-decaprenol L-rhamnosyltransferase
MSVGVVVVAHRSREDVVALLGDLDAATPVVVVDTASGDGTAEAVRAVAPGRPVRLLELENTGYARAANAGIRALPAGVAHAVVLNADVRLAADVPDRLAAVLDADASLGAVGPRVRYPSGAPQASARRIPGLGTAVLHGLLGWWWPANPATRAYRADPAATSAAIDAAGPTGTDVVAVDWVSGCAVALRRTAVEAVGGFDPGYPLFVEDVDLCDRLAAAGWGVGLAPRIVVVHRVGGATSRRPLRARLAHARGLERFASQRLPGPLRPAARLLRPALVAWAVAATVAGRHPDRSSTGERRTDAAVAA